MQQHYEDQLSALLHDLDVTGAEYRTAVESLGRTIGKGDVRASDPAFLSANHAASVAQQRYRRALNAYKEYCRSGEQNGSGTASNAALTLH
jgi:hypothetical protein